MSIVPETKDWTWVLTRSCPECGLDPSALDRDQIGVRTREVAASLAEALLALGPAASVRPSPSVWAPVEYACHVRDVFVLFDDRLRLMLETDGPDFANWDQDATAVESSYLTQDPVVVAASLGPAAAVVAARFEAVTDWERTGNRSDGARFTVDSFARYFLHDPVHHLWDVTRLQPGGAAT